MPAYFDRIAAHHYRPTTHAGGAWRDDEIHFGPLGGLIAHEIDLHQSAREAAPQQLSRLTFDILGVLGTGECEVRVETVRPGRTIELVEATAIIDERPAVRARAWMLAASDTADVAGGIPAPLPAPETLEPWAMSNGWPGGFVASLEVRPTTAPRPGRATAWITTPIDLVAGDTTSARASFIALVDTANGIAVRESPTEWLFPNVDLTIHFHREPEGPWVGFDTTVTFGPSGLGITNTVLHDIRGAVGYANQALTVRSLQK